MSLARWAAMPNIFHLCRSLSPLGESLFFASPKKNNQKKGDPSSFVILRFSGANEPF